MIVKNELINLELDEDIIKVYNLKDIAYFDIEASKMQNGEEFLFAISIGRFLNNTYKVTQYFGEKVSEEKKIIKFSKDILEKYSIWSTFN
ncbi:ribonuclease H-like domain-containing protein, partial [Clostridium sp.]|uniref:ribonuclease H-like domain-containing protein n=1 Tax=Clostridium sp. TaxID=1506 RepID=UPI003463D28A